LFIGKRKELPDFGGFFHYITIFAPQQHKNEI